VKLITLPEVPGSWLGVRLEAQMVAGTAMWSVTIRGRGGVYVERTWHTDEGVALAYACNQADSRHLPLFDMRDGGEAL
jgi:hypothetical protein